MIQNLIFGILFFFGNTILVSGMQLFYIRPHVSVDIFDFLVESLKSQQELAKKITHFTI